MRLINSVAILSTLLFTVIAHAAIPPLSQQERLEYSSNIITGIVTSMKKTVRQKGVEKKDDVYHVTITPTTVEKGDDRASQIKFTFWKAAERPDGWCGPSGQHGIFKHRDEIRVYLQKDDKGNYRLLEPNGFDAL